MPIYSSPILDITLPKPIVIPTISLTGLYVCMLGIDYVLLRNQNRLWISKSSLRVGMTAIHALVPLMVVSPFQPNNVTFAAVPWFLASYSAYLPTENFSIKQWTGALYNTIVESDDGSKSKKDNVHRKGLVKVLRGVFKLALLHFGIEPYLPTNPADMLTYGWFSTPSLTNTFLFGLKAYLILGAADLVAGLAQATTGWCTVDMFDSPLLATSPRDFWSNRWNKHIKNLLHSLVFLPNKLKDGHHKKTDKDDEKSTNAWKQQTGFFSSNIGRGLLTFLVSGAFHELIVCSVSRKLTLENFLFFALNGVACMLEVQYFNNSRPTSWRSKLPCMIAQLSFMVLTGRLFLAPFLRTRFTQVLPLTQFQ